MDAPGLDKKNLSSKWDGLSPHLIASFYEVKKSDDGRSWTPVSDGVTVKAPLTESNMDVALSWQSPFENSGADNGIPAIAAMLQSGALQPYLKMAGIGDGKVGAFVKSFEGRTGITKLNSTQVFTGMPPVKIQVTALFRAWEKPDEEVEEPFSQLMAWALPKYLAPEGAILSLANAVRDGVSSVEASFPSQVPTIIAMKYKGRIFSPLVIESIGVPMNSPIDSSGRYTELSIPMTLCTLTAFDRNDWASSRQSNAFVSTRRGL